MKRAAKSDAVTIVRVRSLSERRLAEASALLDAVGMRARDPEKLARAIEASRAVVVARQAGKIVGFGRLVGDGEYYGAIWDVAVAPALQGKKVGSAIVERLLYAAEREGLYMVALLTASHNFAFYERAGFAVQEHLRAMTRAGNSTRTSEGQHEEGRAGGRRGGVQSPHRRRHGRGGDR